MQTINKILIASLLMIISLCTFAQETKADAVYKNIKKEFVINEDGSVDYTYRKEMELISNRSFFREFGETFIVYNPDFQTLTINEAYTIRKDGSIVQTPENAFNEVLPSGCTDCARYNHMKEMVVTHTALEYNATVVLDYTIHTQPEFISEFMEIINFAETSPVKNYDVFVKAPANVIINEKMLNLRLGATVKEDGDYKIYRWNARNLPQTFSESYMPEYEELYPVLMLSTFKDMQQAYFSFVNQEAIMATDLPESHTAINELISDEKSSLENILAIRDYVIDYIRYNRFDMKYNNYKLATPETVWQTRCGNEAEKAIMMASMFNTAGFSAMPVTFTKPSIYRNEMGCLDVISFWGVRVFYDNTTIIISPIKKSNISMEIEYPDYYTHVISATAETMRANSGNKMPTVISAYGSFSTDDIGRASGVLHYNIDSSKLPTFALKKDESKAADAAKNVKGKAKDIKFNGQKLYFLLDVTGTNFTNMGGGYYSVELPETNYGFSINPAYLNSVRATELVCETTKEHYKYQISIPAKAKYVGESFNKMIVKPFGKLEMKITSDKNGITVERNLEITKDKISAKDYADFREMLILWNDEAFKKIVFKTK